VLHLVASIPPALSLRLDQDILDLTLPQSSAKISLKRGFFRVDESAFPHFLQDGFEVLPGSLHDPAASQALPEAKSGIRPSLGFDNNIRSIIPSPYLIEPMVSCCPIVDSPSIWVMFRDCVIFSSVIAIDFAFPIRCSVYWLVRQGRLFVRMLRKLSAGNRSVMAAGLM